MSDGKRDERKYGMSLMLGQAGLEMVAPIGLGVGLDLAFGCLPWLTVTGAVLGFVGGLTHMIVLANRINREEDQQGPGRRAP
jgi:ATP synthase protein I